MNHPYTIPSCPGVRDFVSALERAVMDGRMVELERLSSGGNRCSFKARIVSVIPAEDLCIALVGDDEIPRSYWIRYLFGIVDADGEKTCNRIALEKHKEAIDRRTQREADGLRALLDTDFVPVRNWITSCLVGKIKGLVNGLPSEFYVFKGQGHNLSSAVVYAKNEQGAVRCMQLLDSSNSTWDVYAIFLQAHFLWPAWLHLRNEVQLRASELRAGQPCLPPEIARDLLQEREALYQSNGLSYDELGPLAGVSSLEQDVPDFSVIFALAERVPAAVLNIYLIVAFDSVQFFDEIDRVDDELLQRFIQYGLAVERQHPTAEQVLETMAIAKLRELVALAGTGFKARGAAAIRDHLCSHMTPMLNRETLLRARYKKYQLLPPPSWTWSQFQFFRGEYRNMLDALHQWMFNGWAPPGAVERFRALA